MRDARSMRDTPCRRHRLPSWFIMVTLATLARTACCAPNAIPTAGDRLRTEDAVFDRDDDAGIEKADTSGCTVLHQTTTYKQEVAPTDIMGLFSIIYDRINEDLDDVVKVEINYVGNVIHRLVGTHGVRATVTREGESGEKTTECMVVPVKIEDSDECSLPEDHAMHHECDGTAQCVNTIGSYECQCPGENEPCVHRSGRGLCSNVTSTADCCTVDEERPNGCHDKTCRSECRRDFRCHTNHCEGQCVHPELCKSVRGEVTCGCKEEEGEVGNGHVCSGPAYVLKTDAEGKLLPGSPVPWGVCGCQIPEVDHCHGVVCGQHSSCSSLDEDGEATCMCNSGFRDIPGMGCMDDSAPSLVLKGDDHITMKQCDKYVELGVAVLDANSENDDRQVGVSYSQPPGRCTPEMGTFTVNYTLNTEWTHPAVQYIVRHVTVEDVDECALDPQSPQAQCPGCSPQCHPHAKCKNKPGTYTCECPKCMGGDGFDLFIPRKSGSIPVGYKDGSGCSDICAPEITLIGDNPLVMQVGISTDLWGNPATNRDYTHMLSELISTTDGGGLCESYEDPSSRCATVIDNNGTHEGIDITDMLKISKPTQLSKNPLRWQVTYQATDKAGNYAASKSRTVEIQEMTMQQYADQEVAKALEARPCPSCTECPKCSSRSQPPKPCKPDASSIVSCRECDCSEVEGCMKTAECGIHTSTSGSDTRGRSGPSSFGSLGQDECRRGRWCLPILLTGGQQLAVALCVLMATGVVLAAATR